MIDLGPRENDDLFWEVPTKSGLDSDELVTKFGHDQPGWTDYHGFRARVLPEEYFEKDPFASWVFKQYPGVKMLMSHYAPYTQYDWHVGYVRACVINRTLNYTIDGGPGDSHMVYSRPENKISASTSMSAAKGVKLYKPLVELKYKPDTYYLFNAQVSHAIWNFDKHRYLISFELPEKIDTLRYPRLIKETKEYYASLQKT
jgi:hypothetical protein